MSESTHTIGFLVLSDLPLLRPDAHLLPHSRFPELNRERLSTTSELVESILKSGLSRLFVDPEDVSEVIWASSNTSHTPIKSDSSAGGRKIFETTLLCTTYSQEIADKYRRRVLGLSGNCMLPERGDGYDGRSVIIQTRQDIEVLARLDMESRVPELSGYIDTHIPVIFPLNNRANTKIDIRHGVIDPVRRWNWDQEKFENEGQV